MGHRILLWMTLISFSMLILNNSAFIAGFSDNILLHLQIFKIS